MNIKMINNEAQQDTQATLCMMVSVADPMAQRDRPTGRQKIIHTASSTAHIRQWLWRRTTEEALTLSSLLSSLLL
jgi:hypothetical protein